MTFWYTKNLVKIYIKIIALKHFVFYADFPWQWYSKLHADMTQGQKFGENNEEEIYGQTF